MHRNIPIQLPREIASLALAMTTWRVEFPSALEGWHREAMTGCFNDMQTVAGDVVFPFKDATSKANMRAYGREPYIFFTINSSTSTFFGWPNMVTEIVHLLFIASTAVTTAV